MKRSLIFAAALEAFCGAARAQQAYDVENLNFDLWCQETQKLPADRCDKRLAGDEADFEDYRAKVEKYEIEHLQQQQTGAQLNRIILHGDPVDNPVTQSPSAAQQQPVAPAQRPQP